MQNNRVGQMIKHKRKPLEASRDIAEISEVPKREAMTSVGGKLLNSKQFKPHPAIRVAIRMNNFKILTCFHFRLLS